MADAVSPSVINVSSSSAKSFAKAILIAYRVPNDRADLIASALVLADLRGVDTHGINRLAGYITRLDKGVLDPSPDLTFDTKTPVMALLDARNTFGFVAGSMAVDKCIEMAETYGMGMVAVRHSNHYGMGATVRQLFRFVVLC